MSLIKSPESVYFAKEFGNYGLEDIGDAQASGLVDSAVDEGGGKTRLTLGVKSAGSVTLDAGTGGSGISGITVDGVGIMSGTELFDTSLTVTANNIAANITANTSIPNYSATNTGALIDIVDESGQGAGANGFVVVATTTGDFSTTDVNMAAGTSEAVDLQNGQWFQVAGTTTYNGILKIKKPVNQGVVSPSEVIIELPFVDDESGTWDLQAAGGFYMGFMPMDALVSGDITAITFVDPKCHVGDPKVVPYPAGIFYPFPGVINSIVVGAGKQIRLYRYPTENPAEQGHKPSN